MSKGIQSKTRNRAEPRKEQITKSGEILSVEREEEEEREEEGERGD